MRWSNLARSALFSVAVCCVIPEAEAVEVFAAPGFAAQADMVTPAARFAGWGCAWRRGGSRRLGSWRLVSWRRVSRRCVSRLLRLPRRRSLPRRCVSRLRLRLSPVRLWRGGGRSGGARRGCRAPLLDRRVRHPSLSLLLILRLRRRRLKADARKATSARTGVAVPLRRPVKQRLAPPRLKQRRWMQLKCPLR